MRKNQIAVKDRQGNPALNELMNDVRERYCIPEPILNRILAIEDISPAKSKMLIQWASKYSGEKIGKMPFNNLIDRMISILEEILEDLGFKEETKPHPDDLPGLVGKIQNMFGELTIQEFELAFFLVIKKDLIVDPHFHNFSISYVSEVINAYKNYRPTFFKKVNEFLPELEKEKTLWDEVSSDVAMLVEIIIPPFEAFCEGESLIPFGYQIPKSFQYFEQVGLFEMTLEEKLKIKEKVLAEMQLERNFLIGDPEEEGLRIQEFQAQNDSEWVRRCRVRACRVAYQHFVDSGICLKQYFHVDFENCAPVNYADVREIRQALEDNHEIQDILDRLGIDRTYFNACVYYSYRQDF